ncbi:MAG: ABC transporter substrate-binding protein, partial [Oscillospiraceae bacterium]|nr:ABC transporter substrate-binding protein [Oscillospiraceae bacterium]
LLAGCGGAAPAADAGKPAADAPATEAPAAPAATEAPEDEPGRVRADTLSVGYSPFNSKFSPFFSETAYDQDAWAMTQVALLSSDRTGAMVFNGIEGETIEYNGTPYTYYGPANLSVTENGDGTVYYDFTLRDDITFSDGEKMTIDDVIFTMYVLADPTYDGSSTIFAQPIEGMEAYRSGMDSRGNVIFAAGPEGYAANDLYTEEQYNAFWDFYHNEAGPLFAQEIVDYCARSYGAGSVAEGAEMWGFKVADGATAADFWAAIVEAYDGDIAQAEEVESAGSTLLSLTIAALGSEYQVGVQTGESAPNITGIQKTGDYSMRVVLTQVDATAIYHLAVTIAPMHYYGDKNLYDYDNNSFGFPKGDLSLVRAKTTQPMGAGPYKFLQFNNGVINFEANENYYLGAPKTKFVNFVQCTTDDDKLNGVVTGTIDITDPSFSTDTVTAIEQANGGAVSGAVITTNTVDNLGYGYIGMNAKVMNVGGDPAGEASKNLRKAFGTLFSVYRDVAIDSYYGERATVINYPISNTSWAAPRPADDGYKVAFSTDVDGNDIYTSSMSAEERYAAAAKAALGFFEAAGYTVENGVLTSAPEGAALEYTFWIPADGTGDHPAFMIVNETKNALAAMGMNLIIKDLTNSSELWDALRAQTVAFWAAAWQATVDPDMYQIYFSGDEGHEPGGSNYQYAIDDAELNQLILDARASTNQEYRKAMYKACLDVIIDWAVEIPTYQRQNAIIFSTERVDPATVTPDITTFYGWMAEIQNLRMN